MDTCGKSMKCVLYIVFKVFAACVLSERDRPVSVRRHIFLERTDETETDPKNIGILSNV